MSPLISTFELRQRLQQGPAPMVLDARFNLGDPEAGARAFEAGHIEGARYVHLNRDLSAPLNGTNGRHPCPRARPFRPRWTAWVCSRTPLSWSMTTKAACSLPACGGCSAG